MQIIDIALSIWGALPLVFNIMGGLALFMFAMYRLRETLGKVSGARVTRILEKVSNNPVKGMLAGTAATIMTQSSSITVLTLIGFVNAGIMTFRQSVNIMLGSEIGTTVVAQIVAFEVGMAYWPLIATGFFVRAFSRKERTKLIGDVVFSLGLMFLGMDFIKQGAAPLASSPVFVDTMSSFGTNPLVGILVGAILAGITNSSAGTVSLVIALGRSGLVSLPAGIALVLGANIGTTFFELFAGMGATSPAKRTALAQALINIVGVTLFFPFLAPYANVVALTASDLPRQIANAHTIFNVMVSLALIPVVGGLVRLCEIIIPDKPGEIIGKHMFDDEMLHYPQAALLEAEHELTRTADITIQMIQLSRMALLDRNLQNAQRVMKLDREVEENCRATERFLDKIKDDHLNDSSILWRTKLLAVIVDIRRVGDLASNIAEFASDRVNRDITFSDTGVSDLNRMFDLAEEAYSTAVQSLKTKNADLARQTERLEEQIDAMERELKAGHISRMEAGVCNPKADTIFVETVRNLERIGDHADSIALDVIAEY
jgi:phosphate:Na+ symporter